MTIKTTQLSFSRLFNMHYLKVFLALIFNSKLSCIFAQKTPLSFMSSIVTPTPTPHAPGKKTIIVLSGGGGGGGSQEK